MQQLKCKTKGDVKPKGKPRVYFTCHPADFADCFLRICADLFKTHDCAVYYTEDLSAPVEELPEEFNLVIVPVTRRLLTEANRAMEEDVPWALAHCIPVLPVLVEQGLDALYAQPDKFGSLQYLDAGSTDLTQIAYGDKLKKYLDTVLLSRELTDRIRAAFTARIFLSYRKKDRRFANDLMRMIHRHPQCRDIAIWFDEFLTPGESFSDNIHKILADSKLFALLVTPNLLEEPEGKPNFVMEEEYPAARDSGMGIFPVQMQETDQAALREKFRGIPPCIDPYEQESFSASLGQAVAKLALRSGGDSPVHTFLIGLAYLEGIDMEVDRQRAVAMITEAARAELPEAMEKLIHMYTNGAGVPRDEGQVRLWSKALAQYYYRCYGQGRDSAVLGTLFANYKDPYWAETLRQFLLITDGQMTPTQVGALWEQLTRLGICEYTLLFSAAGEMTAHRALAQGILLGDLLEKSSDGTYPPYGPLFWYVPEFDLYEPLLCRLAELTGHPRFGGMVALCRDVCWIFGQYHTAAQVTGKVTLTELPEKAQLQGVRLALCQLFYAGSTRLQVGQQVYPRCFNLREAQAFMDTGSGVLDRMTEPFADELGLYSHEMYSLLDGEWVGVVAAPYDEEKLDRKLARTPGGKLRGLILSPTEEVTMGYISCNRSHVEVIYIPENARDLWHRSRWRDRMPLKQDVVNLGALFYFRGDANIPPELTSLGVECCSGCQSMKTVTIPEGVVKIGWDCFESCRSLEEIRLPDSLRKIESRAFLECVSVRSIRFGHGLQTLESQAFAGCTALETVALPDSLKTLRTSVFSGCTSLKNVTLGAGLEQIDDCVFAECTALETLTLPDSVTQLGSKVFRNCSAMRRLSGCPVGYTHAYLGLPPETEIAYREGAIHALTVSGDTPVIPEKAYTGGRDFDRLVVAEGVTAIEHAAFFSCVALEQVQLPRSLTRLGCRCFMNCSSLTEVTFSHGLLEIGEGAFMNCENIKTLALPDSVTRIGENAFRSCSALGTVKLPEKLKVIGRKAFGSCPNLTCAVFPDSLERLEEFVFEFCHAIKRIENCPAGYTAQYLGVEPDTRITYREEAAYPMTLEDAPTQVTQEQFAHRRDISQVALPDSVTRIEDRAFACCGGLRRISIPDSVTHIGQQAFRCCTRLEQVTVPDGVEELGEETFASCSALTQVQLGAGLTYLGKSGFRDCVSLAQITLPAGLKDIGNWVFSGCTALRSVVLPESLQGIDSRAFQNCTALQAVEIPERVEFLGSQVFVGCTCLETVTFRGPLEETGPSVFEGCTALKRLAFPEGMQQIARYICRDCTALESVTIPDSVTLINRRAFENCSALETLFIPESVQQIGDSAFAGCTGLKEVTLPKQFEDALSWIFTDVDLSQTEIHWL